MAYLNKVMLIGNIGKDPEIRVTPTGKKKVSFSLATSRRFRDASGEPREMTDWHNIVGWGKIADIVETLNVRKGMSLFVEGTLTYRSWDDQATGQKRYATDINMDTFQLLTPRSQGQGGSSYPASASGNQSSSYSRPAFDNNVAGGYDNPPAAEAEDDLPF
jgi:single-strand DNA-binding protein